MQVLRRILRRLFGPLINGFGPVSMRALIEAAGCDLWRLPAYSPDYKPDREVVEQGQVLAASRDGRDVRGPAGVDRRDHTRCGRR